MVSELVIKTSEKKFLKDLRKENIPDLVIEERVFRMDSSEFIIDASTIITVVISSASTVALSLFSQWLYDYFKNKNSKEATINNTNIINNPKQSTVIINNYIQYVQCQEAETKNNQ